MKIKKHEQTVKQAALARAQSRSANETLADVASSFKLKLGTLKGWLKQVKEEQRQSRPGTKLVGEYTAAEQLEALLETAAMTDVARSAWCRQRGLFVHQLQAWKQSLSAPKSSAGAEALRESQQALKRAQMELRRKDKALAEAAALLVLQKKFQSLFSDEAV
jgi:transposase-like protein